MPGRIPCPPDADPALDLELDCWKKVKSGSRPPIGISRGAWDRVTRNATWRVPRSWRLRRWRDSFAVPANSLIAILRESTQNCGEQRGRRREGGNSQGVSGP